ncbi:hypothetical protein ARSEF1564_009421 [Beauveria bassiana]
MAHLPPPPWGHRWRSARPFVIATVGIGLFSDLFLYGIVVPVIPFLLRDRLGVDDDDAIQTQTSRQLAATAMLCAGTSTAVLMAARLLQGISVAAMWAVGFATVQDLVGTSELGKVTGIIYSFVSVGELVALALGGFLYELGGMGAIFAVSAIVLLLDLTMRLLMLDKMEMDNYKVVPDLDKDQATSDSRDSVAAQACPSNANETSPLLERSEELEN